MTRAFGHGMIGFALRPCLQRKDSRAEEEGSDGDGRATQKEAGGKATQCATRSDHPPFDPPTRHQKDPSHFMKTRPVADKPSPP